MESTEERINCIERRALPAASCVLCTSRSFDTSVKVYDEEAQKWRGFRPSIAAVIDVSSRELIAFQITLQPVTAKMYINILTACHYSEGLAPKFAILDTGRNNSARCAAALQQIGIQPLRRAPDDGRIKELKKNLRYLVFLVDRISERAIFRISFFDTAAEDMPSFKEFCECFKNCILVWARCTNRGQQKVMQDSIDGMFDITGADLRK